MVKVEVFNKGIKVMEAIVRDNENPHTLTVERSMVEAMESLYEMGQAFDDMTVYFTKARISIASLNHLFYALNDPTLRDLENSFICA